MNSALSPREPETSPAERVAAAVAVAFAFLTILPTWLLARDTTDEDVKASRFAYPVVGITLGLLLAGLSWFFQRAGIAPATAAFLIVAVLAALTGGLHLDGLADTSDGLFLWGDAERRLAVMRDPHVGSYGVTMVVLTLLGKYAALSSLTGGLRTWGVFSALAVSRTLILVSAGRAPYARAEGTGRLLVEATTRHEAVAAGALSLLVASLSNHFAGLVAGLAGVALAVSFTALAKRRLGGVSGDILGALAELGETVYLLVLSCFTRA